MWVFPIPADDLSEKQDKNYQPKPASVSIGVISWHVTDTDESTAWARTKSALASLLLAHSRSQTKPHIYSQRLFEHYFIEKNNSDP